MKAEASGIVGTALLKNLPPGQQKLIFPLVPPASASPLTAATTTVDVCIVGQGIAGSLLGYVLHHRGLRVRIIDDGHKSSASLVAAGMINPIQGQKLNLIWEAERCLPAAFALYRELEAHFGRQFFFAKKILKLLQTEAQAQALQKHLQNPAFAPWLGTIYPPGYFGKSTAAGKPAHPARCTAVNNSDHPLANPTAAAHSSAADAATDSPTANNSAAVCPAAAADPQPLSATDASDLAVNNALHDPFGSFEITGGGYLDTAQLLHAMRTYFRSEGILVEAHFAYPDLDLSDPACVRWHGLEAQRIIFAEGWRILENPLFAHYPFTPTKGQILTVQAAAPLPDCVLNHGKWLVPQGTHEAWIGATYERNNTDPLPTAEGAQTILTHVQGCIPDNPLQVLSQRAGIRLATPDYIPRIGFLPTDARIGVFSAFSSKGNCFAPYLVNCLADYMLNGTALPPKADMATKKIAPKKSRDL